MKTLAQAVKQYQKLHKESKNLEAAMQKVQQQHHELKNYKNKKYEQMRSLKNLIDHCVITGESPSQALLSHTAEQIETSVQEHNSSVNRDIYYIDSGLITINSLTSTAPLISSSSWNNTLTVGDSINNGVP